MENIVLTSIPLETLEERFSNVVDQKLHTLLTAIKDQKLEQQPKEYLSRKEAAKLLGVSLVTLNEWTKSGVVQAYRIASRVRFKRVEVEASLQRIKSGKK